MSTAACIWMSVCSMTRAPPHQGKNCGYDGTSLTSAYMVAAECGTRMERTTCFIVRGQSLASGLASRRATLKSWL